MKNKKYLIIVGIVILLALIAGGGFLFLRSSYFDHPGRVAIRNKIVNPIRNIPYFYYTFKSSDLPVYDLYINQNNLDILNKALPKTTDVYLSDDLREKVVAKLVYQGTEYKITANYRGNGFPHWFYDKKSWSFKLDNEETIEGHSKLNFILPQDRIYVVEYFDNYRARKLGLVAPDDKFVILRINGGPEMLYYQMEGWDENFLKRNNGTVLYAENDLKNPIFQSVGFWDKPAVLEKDTNDFTPLAKLLDLMNRADGKEFKEKIGDVLDMDGFYSWNILNMLASSRHQNSTHNVRFYYNEKKGKLVLIPWDVAVEPYTSNFKKLLFGDLYDIDFNYNPLETRILSIPEFLAERNKRLWNYVKDDKNLEEDLNFYDAAWEKIKSAAFNDPVKLESNAGAENEAANSRNFFITNYNFLRGQLEKAQVFAIVSFKSNSLVPATIDIEYRSASPIKFDGLGISFKGFNGQAFFQLYEDTNNNGVLDWEDAKVSDLKYREGALMGETGVLGDQVAAYGIGKLLFTKRAGANPMIEDQTQEAQVSLKLTKKRFFVISSSPVFFEKPLVDLNIFNGTTGSKIGVTPQFYDLSEVNKSVDGEQEK